MKLAPLRSRLSKPYLCTVYLGELSFSTQVFGETAYIQVIISCL